MDQVVIIQMVISATGVVPKTLDDNIEKLPTRNYVLLEIYMSRHKKISKSLVNCFLLILKQAETKEIWLIFL